MRWPRAPRALCARHGATSNGWGGFVGWGKTSPLFPVDGKVANKTAVIAAFRSALAAAGVPTTFIDEDGATRQYYAGHCLRVAGAQYLSRAGVDLATIQELGRWSSTAVWRYVQQAPLTRAHLVTSAASTSTATVVRETSPDIPDFQLVQAPPKCPAPAAQVVGDQPTVYIMHRRSRKLHKPARDETTAETWDWSSPCGWRYGPTTYFRLQSLPPGPVYCRRCFADANEVVSSASSSSSSDFGTASESSASS